MSATVSIQRSTILKLLPQTDVQKTEALIEGLVSLAKRIDENPQSQAIVLMTEVFDFTVADVMQLRVGDHSERISSVGIHTLMLLYRTGFLTGSRMVVPAMVERISNNLMSKAA